MPEPSTLTQPARRRARRLHAQPCGPRLWCARALGAHRPPIARRVAWSSDGLRARLFAPCDTDLRTTFAVEERA